MKDITPEITIKELLDHYPATKELFVANGITMVNDPDTVNSIGHLMKLGTLLSSAGIDTGNFIKNLHHAIHMGSDTELSLGEREYRQGDLTLLCLLPCGVKTKLGTMLDQFINALEGPQIRYLTEGNVNYETYYDRHAGFVKNSDELPDVIVTSDINSFFHQEFINTFVKKDVFIAEGNFDDANFGGVDFQDPEKHYTMLAMNVIILVVDKLKLGNRQIPRSWKDLLRDEYRGCVVLRGDNDFFCNAVLLPYYKENGIESVAQLAENVIDGLHPAEMAKRAGSGREDGAAIYAMPYFFARTIKHQENIEIVLPEEGAVVSPISMLVKREKADHVKHLTDFLTGEAVANLFAASFFPTPYSGVENRVPAELKYRWVGWDFIMNNDIGAIKDEISRVFMAHYKKK